MFTGIVEERGEVLQMKDLGDSVRLTVRGPRVTSDAGLGDSIAVNGCCLTVAELHPGNQSFEADVMAESLAKTSLGDLQVGSEVNLERAVTPSTRLGGHIVQGHVDGTGQLIERTPSEHWEVLWFSVPEYLVKYLVEKGSVTVDGTSLTVVEVVDAPEPRFSVSLIPTTLADTVLGAKQLGDRVNLEVDVLAKYVERLIQSGQVAP